VRECNAYTFTKKENDSEVVVKFQNNFETSSGKKVAIANRAQTNSMLSTKLLKLLSSHNLPNFFKGLGSGGDIRVKAIEDLPVVFEIENDADATAVSILYYLVDDQNHEKQVEADEVLKVLSKQQLHELRRQSLKANVILKDYFKRRELELQKYRLEFGKLDNKLYLSTIFTMDSCDFVDLEMNEKLSYNAIVKKTDKAESLFKAFMEKLNR